MMDKKTAEVIYNMVLYFSKHRRNDPNYNDVIYQTAVNHYMRGSAFSSSMTDKQIIEYGEQKADELMAAVKFHRI